MTEGGGNKLRALRYAGENSFSLHSLNRFKNSRTYCGEIVEGTWKNLSHTKTRLNMQAETAFLTDAVGVEQHS